MSTSLKIIFAGTPDFAAQHLQALLNSQHQIVGVYTQPDRPAGRGKKLQASPVKQLALQHNIDVFQPASLRESDAQAQLASLDADVMVVVAYGLILPEAVLATPRLGCLNVHGSLLPRWRGAAPIQRAIWAGDAQTGVTVMQMDKGLDTGAMLLKMHIDITPEDTSASLYQKLAELGPKALLETLDNINTIEPEVQNDELANYAQKLSKQEAKIDWQLDAEQLARNVRAFNPWPVAFFEIESDGKMLPIKVWQAEVIDNGNAGEPGTITHTDKHGIVVATPEGSMVIKSLQIPGKKAMPVADVINARKEWFSVGTKLS